MPEPAADRLVPVPAVGRTYRGRRLARFGDLDPSGRLRLDALARYLQDVSSDDTTDAGLANDVAWVVRRTLVEMTRTPRFREQLELCTFCSGTGGRWAERRVSVVGERGAAVECASLWVHLDAESGRPQRLPDDFHRHYDQAAGGRTVSARLQHSARGPRGGRSPAVRPAGHRLRPARPRQQRRHLGDGRTGAGRATPAPGAVAGRARVPPGRRGLRPGGAGDRRGARRHPRGVDGRAAGGGR